MTARKTFFLFINRRNIVFYGIFSYFFFSCQDSECFFFFFCRGSILNEYIPCTPNRLRNHDGMCRKNASIWGRGVEREGEKNTIISYCYKSIIRPIDVLCAFVLFSPYFSCRTKDKYDTKRRKKWEKK